MSILNDVLRNIDEQKAQQRNQILATTEASETKLPMYLPWLLGTMLLAIVLLTVQVFSLRQAAIDIPSDLYDDPVAMSIPTLHQVNPQQSTSPAAPSEQSISTVKQANSPEAVLEKSQQKHEKANANIDIRNTSIVKKTETTEAEESALAALSAGETERVKDILPKAQPSMQQNLNLRIMVKEAPEQVVPYLQENHPDFTSNNEFLALAAQAQQRSGEHKMAIVYYQQLAKREPHEARWVAGLAISLDGLGEREKAVSIYESVLKTGALPPPLKRFVTYRLEQIGEQYGG